MTVLTRLMLDLKGLENKRFTSALQVSDGARGNKEKGKKSTTQSKLHLTSGLLGRANLDKVVI